MTKAKFVDLMRGPDKRDKNPNLSRIIPEASTGDVLWASLSIVALICLLVSLIVAILGACTQQYHLLLAFFGSVASIALMILSQSIIGIPRYENIRLTMQELRTYTGQHVFIHFLNNVTGYEDGWYPFYGATEEFVRINGTRPELCVAPFEQYGRGWVAYFHQMTQEELKKELERNPT